MTLHVLFEVRRRLELLFAGLAGVDSDARQLFAMLLQVQGELALQHKLISALWTDQILQARRGETRGVMLADGPAPGLLCWADWLPTSSFSCSMMCDLRLAMRENLLLQTGQVKSDVVCVDLWSVRLNSTLNVCGQWSHL